MPTRRKKTTECERPEETGRPVVTFERDGQRVWLVDPPHVGALDVLATARHDLVSRGGRGPALLPTPEPLVRQCV